MSYQIWKSNKSFDLESWETGILYRKYWSNAFLKPLKWSPDPKINLKSSKHDINDQRVLQETRHKNRVAQCREKLNTKPVILICFASEILKPYHTPRSSSPVRLYGCTIITRISKARSSAQYIWWLTGRALVFIHAQFLSIRYLSYA